MKRETKFLEVAPEVVADGTIKGYASLFGVKDQGGDIVQPGAFTASLSSGRGVKMLWQHDPLQPIGRWNKVLEDERGLYVEGQLALKTQRGAEAYEMLREGIIEGLSIGYTTKRSKRTTEGRLLYEVDIWEVSVVTFQMLLEGRIDSVKSYEEGNFALFKRTIEDAARDAGFPSVEAKAAAAGAVNGLLGARDAAETSAADVAELIRQIATSK